MRDETIWRLSELIMHVPTIENFVKNNNKLRRRHDGVLSLLHLTLDSGAQIWGGLIHRRITLPRYDKHSYEDRW